MRILPNFLKKIICPDNQSQTLENSSINFETDSIRFLFESYLAEYEVHTRGILQREELQERITTYLLLIIGGLISLAQVLGEQTQLLVSSLNQIPIVYLLLSFITFFLPVRMLMHTLSISANGKYIRYVLAPKINMIVLSLSQHDDSVHEFIAWDREHFSTSMQGSLRWEEYHNQTFFKRYALVFGIVSLFRYVVVSVPAIVFILAFFIAKADDLLWQDWALEERILFSLYFLILLVLIVGLGIAIRQIEDLPER